MAGSPGSFSLWNSSRVVLKGEINNRRIEIATLFDANGAILVG